ncbi:MAG TPA: D-proline reductase (dithiol) proprotein PrdA [Selenomonadales bacterium]|nr:D-proline reductase (dithiol) proprotein PrdA [Selenomonadales bacterium]
MSSKEKIVTAGDVLNISIEEGRDIKLQVRLNGGAAASESGAAPGAAEARREDKVIRTLKQREFAVKKVELGKETSFKDGVLVIRKQLCVDALEADPLVKKIEMDIITPDKRHQYTNTIMDVIPIATKVEGELGEGITNVMSGVVFIITGVDENGVQVHEFGSCEGYLDEKIRYGRPGCPDEEDIMIRVHTIIAENTGMERRGPHAAHKACDAIIQEIREVLKKAPAEQSVKENVYRDVVRHGRPRVVLVKEIMGQGAMHDNVMIPTEPAGVLGGRQNVDLGNVPIILSPNQVRDGGIHALTCIGPATKEDTRHYFREPLVNLMAEDDEINLVGVIFIGSPQVNDEKTFVSARLGSWVEALDVEGAIVTTEGFGNNHIDFAGNIEQIGKRGVAVVGVTYSAYQGALVVGNKYMDAMIELNKDKGGFESEILGDSTVCPEDAERAVLMLKTKIAGVPIEGADRHWNQSVVVANQAITDRV